MRFQKAVLVMFQAGVATTAMAEVKWEKISFNNKSVNLYMDTNSIQTKVDKYKNRYLEARFSRAYGEPRKMETQNKYYSHYFETLSVDCANGAYASSNWKWSINNKAVHQSAGKADDWNKYDSDDRSTTAVSARALCKHYKSFLG